MFNSITWEQYFSATILLVTFYYLIIGCRFYKWEILKIIGITKVDDSDSLITSGALSNLQGFNSVENNEDYLPKPSLEVDFSPLIQSFMDEVTAFVQGNNNAEITKEEVINSLEIICSKYPVVKKADSRKDLEVEILKEINLKYSLLFESKDLKNLWK